MKIEIIIAIISVIPAISAPLIAYYLSNKGLSRKANEYSIIDKRLELLKKFQSLDNSSFKTNLEQFFEKEMDDIVSDVEDLRDVVISDREKVIKRNFLKRMFLNFDLVSVVAKVYRGLYWFFLIMTIFGLILLLNHTLEDLTSGIIGLMIYLIIALIFRSSAFRRYKKIISKQKNKA